MKRGALPLNALRAFEAVMRHGQMGLAAAELGVTHSAVSRQVRGLEEVLGVRLFDGPRNRLVPSEAARALHPSLQEGFDLIEAGVARTLRQERQALDVSCTSTLAMRWLIPRLVGFQAAHPAIEIRLTAADGPVDFARQPFDLAIRVGRGPWPGAEVTELFPDCSGPVARPELLAGVETPESLLALPRLHTKTRPTAWEEWCRAKGWPDPGTGGGREFEHFYFMLEGAVAGLGVAIAPEVLVRDDLAAGRLAAPFGFAGTGRRYVVLRRPGSGRAAAIFTAWLAES
ncbi:LysR substrate-binding domain-containing protein [Pseudoroseicyclus tamaricis]|uniref:LysR family transcriptional regulator n=1 Tax=Pseudoroseicyclus tamaricis TaxID=2705421 RepID=A0A6B2JKH4_9RHOB|nr:LysR substrate-binding domain-containing protein [Pseudoroseicyclus tamaricis]NDV01991.1 LysR family transcriptional regulator [Pseudoroseicyclus tamaricis]